MKKKIIIIGAGLGGATLAIALIQRGFKVKVYEQAAILQELGAGLTVPATAMRSFNSLGIWERVRDICTLSAGFTFVHYKTGEILTGTPDYDFTHKPENPNQGAHTHRAYMHKLLVDVVQELDPQAIVTDHRLRTLTQTGDTVTVEFENGARDSADAVIGCDGLHSVTHRLLFGENKPTFTGVVALRTTVPTEKVKQYLGGGRASKFVGPDRGFNRYSIKNGTQINCVALVKSDKFKAEGWSNRSSREEMMEYYGDFHSDVTGIIENAPDDSIYRWALYDRDPLQNWTKGRVTLLGDAAHPMLPYLGQGATQATDDAIVLARALDQYDDVEEAFAAYQAVRIPRTAFIIAASRQQAAALNQPDPYRYKELRMDGAQSISGYDASTVPI
jgi:salicylate hydroxylase